MVGNHPPREASCHRDCLQLSAGCRSRSSLSRPWQADAVAAALAVTIAAIIAAVTVADTAMAVVAAATLVSKPSMCRAMCVKGTAIAADVRLGEAAIRRAVCAYCTAMSTGCFSRSWF